MTSEQFQKAMPRVILEGKVGNSPPTLTGFCLPTRLLEILLLGEAFTSRLYQFCVIAPTCIFRQNAIQAVTTALAVNINATKRTKTACVAAILHCAIVSDDQV